VLQCPTCSTHLERASRFCPACGGALSGPAFDDATLLSDHILNASVGGPRSGMSPPPSAAWLATHSSGENVGFAPGTLVGGRFRIIGLLGRGGMGDVYRADDLVLGQPVALKFLPRDLARDSNRLTRFFGEVRIARTVSHPNVCRVYDIGEIDGQPYMSMELVDGDDLASLLPAHRPLASRQGARGEPAAVRWSCGGARKRRPASRSQTRERHHRCAGQGPDHRLRFGGSGGRTRHGPRARRHTRIHGARAVGA
jgi:hypothetical protein